MLFYAVIFFLVALVAAPFAFGGLVGSVAVAKILFFVFVLLACIGLIAGVFRRG